jgi:hypothetical protein
MFIKLPISKSIDLSDKPVFIYLAITTYNNNIYDIDTLYEFTSDDVKEIILEQIIKDTDSKHSEKDSESLSTKHSLIWLCMLQRVDTLSDGNLLLISSEKEETEESVLNIISSYSRDIIISNDIRQHIEEQNRKNKN